MTTIDLTEDTTKSFNSELGSKTQKTWKRTPSGQLPFAYVCNKCNVKGHWIQDCPGIVDINGKVLNVNKIKRPTGIPTIYLTEVEPGTPNCYLTTDGRYVIPKGTLMALKRSEIQETDKSGIDKTAIRPKESFRFEPKVQARCETPQIENQRNPTSDKNTPQETLPTWSLDKLLEKEITGIIMAADDAELTEEIFNISNTRNKLMLTAEDMALIKTKKIEQISKTNQVKQDWQQISVVNLTNEESRENPFGMVVDVDGFFHDAGDGFDGCCYNDDIFSIQCDDNSVKDREDLYQRQLEEEFLKKITDKPVIIKDTNSDKKSQHSKYGHDKEKRRPHHGDERKRNKYSDHKSGSIHRKESHRRRSRSREDDLNGKSKKRSRSRSDHQRSRHKRQEHDVEKGRSKMYGYKSTSPRGINHQCKVGEESFRCKHQGSKTDDRLWVKDYKHGRNSPKSRSQHDRDNARDERMHRDRPHDDYRTNRVIDSTDGNYRARVGNSGWAGTSRRGSDGLGII